MDCRHVFIINFSYPIRVTCSSFIDFNEPLWTGKDFPLECRRYESVVIFMDDDLLETNSLALPSKMQNRNKTNHIIFMRVVNINYPSKKRTLNILSLFNEWACISQSHIHIQTNKVDFSACLHFHRKPSTWSWAHSALD